MAPVSSLAAAASRMTLATPSTKSSKNTNSATICTSTGITNKIAAATGPTKESTPASSSTRKRTPPRKEPSKKSSLAQYASPIKSNEGTKHYESKDQIGGNANANANANGRKGKGGSSSARKADKPHSVKKNDSLEPIAQFEFSLDDTNSDGNDKVPAVNRSHRNGHSKNEAGNRKQHQQQHQRNQNQQQNQNPSHSSKNNDKKHPSGDASNGKVINVNVSKRLIGSALGKRIPANHTNNDHTQNTTGRRNEHERIDRNDKRRPHPQGNRNRNSSDRISTGTGREDTGRHESRSWDNTKNNSSTQGMHQGRNNRWGSGDNNSNAKNKGQDRNNRHALQSSSRDTARLDSTSNPKVEERADHKPRLVSRSEVKGPIGPTQMTNWADDSDSD